MNIVLVEKQERGKGRTAKAAVKLDGVCRIERMDPLLEETFHGKRGLAWIMNEEIERLQQLLEERTAVKLYDVEVDGSHLVGLFRNLSSDSFELEFLNPPQLSRKEQMGNLTLLHAVYESIFIHEGSRRQEGILTMESGRYLLEHVDYNFCQITGLRRLPARIEIRTEGIFRVFVDGRTVAFGRKKSRELLALLVDRRGVPMDRKEAWNILWPGEIIEETLDQRFRSEWRHLRNLLKRYGIEHILRKEYKYRYLDISQIICDAYEGEGEKSCDYLMEYDWVIRR